MARLAKANASSPTDPTRLVVAHVDHGVRGDASTADADFVRAEAESLSLPFYLGVGSSAENKSLESSVKTNPSESSLRELRYRCLREAAQKHGARYLVTGHTLDDQIETVLFRIFRGTGLRGLNGIPTFRKLGDQLTLVRPMLSVSRDETHAYLQRIGRQHQVDASNEDSHYTRNFLRNELLPLARKKFPDIDRAILRLSEAAHDHQQAMPQLVAAASESISIIEKESAVTELQVDCKTIRVFPNSIIVDALIEHWDGAGWPRGDINRAAWNQVAQLIRSHDPRKGDQQRQVINLPGNLRAERNASTLTIAQDRV